MADITKIPFVTVPFADTDQQKVTNLEFLKSGVMTAPTQNGGTILTRGHLNGIGYFATLGAFLDRIGYPYGIRRESSADFGGYPKGAILISEDDDYVREYVSQIDNNKTQLPKEAASGTYEGNEYWKPTLPKVADFYPNYSTDVSKVSERIEGAGKYLYTPDEDGWYQLALLFTGGYWPDKATYDNEFGISSCSVKASDVEGTKVDICTLDGRCAIKRMVGAWVREVPYVTTLVPLHKGQRIEFDYNLPVERYYEAQLTIRRWGVSTL